MKELNNKSVNCSEVSGNGCHFVAQGQSVQQVRRALFRHTENSHSYIIQKSTAQDLLRMKRKMDNILA